MPVWTGRQLVLVEAPVFTGANFWWLIENIPLPAKAGSV